MLGAGAGLLVIDQSWSLEITSERVVAKRGSDVRRIPADRVGIVYRTGRRTVVIEGRDGAELFKGTVEGDRGTVPVAFAQQGYPWDEV